MPQKFEPEYHESTRESTPQNCYFQRSPDFSAAYSPSKDFRAVEPTPGSADIPPGPALADIPPGAALADIPTASTLTTPSLLTNAEISRRYWRSNVRILLRPSIAEQVAADLMQRICDKEFHIGQCYATISPVGWLFPGTKDRLLTLRSQSLEVLLNLLKRVGQKTFESSVAESVHRQREFTPVLRIAVPRKVIGTLIGRKGSHIQEFRASTPAHIHISPIFVAANAASSDRIVSVSSQNMNAFIDAVEALVIKLHSYPEFPTHTKQPKYQPIETRQPLIINNWFAIILLVGALVVGIYAKTIWLTQDTP